MISRKIVGPRWVAIAVQNNDITIIDPAIDLDNSNIKDYEESLFDVKHLKALPGEQWSLFEIKPLTRRQKDALDSYDADAQSRMRAAWAIRCGLTGTKNYQIVANGGSSEIGLPEIKQNGAMGAMITEGWMDKFDMPELFLYGLASMIRKISEASGPLFNA
jgi:hypothetical protein